MQQFGFKNIEEVIEYTGNLNYDIVLIDVDSIEGIKNFEIQNDYKNCFVTGFDLYSIKKGFEIIRSFEEKAVLTKVLFSRNFTKAENQYLEYLTSETNVEWDSENYSFPIEIGNYSVMIENQATSRIRIKKMSEAYKHSLIYLTSNLFAKEISLVETKKIVKSMERV